MKRLVIKPFISKFIPCRWQKEEYYLRLKVRIIHHVSPSCLLKQFITARKRSLGQGHIFTSVCHSVHRGETPPEGSASSGVRQTPPLMGYYGYGLHPSRGGPHPEGGSASRGSASSGICLHGVCIRGILLRGGWADPLPI